MYFMKQNSGFSIIEMFITLVFIGILFGIVGSTIFNNPGATEQRGNENFDKFILGFNLPEDSTVLRKSCAHDSDGDGASSCSATIGYANGAMEKIFAQCPSGIVADFMGAEACKETAIPTKIGIGVNQNTSAFSTR